MFRRVIHIMLLVLLCLSSCVSHEERAEALQTVAEADSLDSNGILFSDIVRLSHAVDALCGLTHRTEKAKALYYLGRNYSLIGEDATAVDYYIEAERLEPNNQQLRGLLYSNMGYICAQQQEDSLAVIFFDKSARFYHECRDSIRYAYVLLQESYSYVMMGCFSTADSLWKESALITSNDDIFLSQLWVYRAYYYNRLGEYNQALEYVTKSDKSPDKSYLYWQYALTYYNLCNLDSCAYYAERILSICSNAAHVMDAYFFLGQKAEKDNDIKKIAYYADKRNDWEYIARRNNNQRVLAISKIEEYLLHPDTSITLVEKVLISLSVILLLCLCIVVYFVKKESSRTIIQQEQSLREKDNIIAQQNQYETERIVEKKKVVENNIILLRESLSASSFSQKNEQELFKEINAKFFQLTDKLKSKQFLSQVEIKFCIAVLLYSDYSVISDYMNCSRNGISKTKKRIAEKLGTTGAQLHNKLIDIALH